MNDTIEIHTNRHQLCKIVINCHLVQIVLTAHMHSEWTECSRTDAWFSCHQTERWNETPILHLIKASVMKSCWNGTGLCVANPPYWFTLPLLKRFISLSGWEVKHDVDPFRAVIIINSMIFLNCTPGAHTYAESLYMRSNKAIIAHEGISRFKL